MGIWNHVCLTSEPRSFFSEPKRLADDLKRGHHSPVLSQLLSGAKERMCNQGDFALCSPPPWKWMSWLSMRHQDRLQASESVSPKGWQAWMGLLHSKFSILLFFKHLKMWKLSLAHRLHKGGRQDLAHGLQSADLCLWPLPSCPLPTISSLTPCWPRSTNTQLTS